MVGGWTEPMRRHFEPFLEHTTEATVACVFAMVQGNLLALSLSHWWIASQTGVAAGSATAFMLWLLRLERPWVISIAFGVLTAVLDAMIHPGMFGPEFFEAGLTGVVAALLSMLGQRVLRRNRSRAAT